jgi:hypothetical protein
VAQNLKKKTVKKKSKNKLYFGKEAHDAIVRFQKTECLNEKEKIYEEEIRKSFHKLVENLIFIHGFAKDALSFQILKSDCVTFLYETLGKFNPDKGSKAFSYFNVCAKNFLIIQTNKKNKIKNRHVSLENFSDMSQKDKQSIESYGSVSSPEKSLIFNEDKEYMFEVLEIISNKAKNQNEKKCASAITTLFKSIDELEFLNKRAIFVYLREISGLNPKQLSVSMSNIRRYYKDIIKNNDDYQFLFKGLE